MPSWYNPSWSYRIPVTVTNNSATSALSYYQCGIALSGTAYTSLATDGKADLSDLRITDSDGVTLLDFMLEGIDTTNSVVYLLVKVPYVAGGGTDTIYAYYGNPSATSVAAYSTTVGPHTAISASSNIFAQATQAGFNANPNLILLQHQTGANASLNGRILAFCVAGITNGNSGNDGKIGLSYSTDGGSTWTPSILLSPTSGDSLYVRSVCERADGSILLCYSYSSNTLTSAGKAAIYWASSPDGSLGTWTNLSTSPTNAMSVPWTYGTDVATVYGGAIETSAGGDLYVPGYKPGTVYLLKCPGGSDPTVGTNWVNQGTIVYDGTHTFSETWVVQIDSTHYAAISRNDTASGDGDLYITKFTSSGSTLTVTSGPSRMYVSGVQAPSANAVSPFVRVLANGDYMIMWGIRYTTASVYGVGAYVSTDGLSSWTDRETAIPLGEATTNSALLYGYPQAVQRSDGKIVLGTMHEAGGSLLSDAIGLVLDEDWLVNSPNQYDDCTSFGAAWTSHGAQATIDTTHVHSAASAIKLDNSAGSGASATRLNWLPTVTKSAYSFWSYGTQNAAALLFDTMDSSGTPVKRVQSVIYLTTELVRWYNGSAYQNTTGTAPLNQWNKLSLCHDVEPTTVQGQILLNDASIMTPTNIQYNSGVNAKSVLFQAGSSTGATSTTYWIADVYTQQYAPSLPSFTVGSPQSNITFMPWIFGDQIEANGIG